MSWNVHPHEAVRKRAVHASASLSGDSILQSNYQILARVVNAWQPLRKHQVLRSKVSRTRHNAHCNHQTLCVGLVPLCSSRGSARATEDLTCRFQPCGVNDSVLQQPGSNRAATGAARKQCSPQARTSCIFLLTPSRQALEMLMPRAFTLASIQRPH
jgi:hypothetical protein